MPITHPAALDVAYGANAWTPYTRVTLINPDGSAVDAEPIDGDVSWDDTSWPRTRLSMTLPTSLTPGESVSPVSPWGGLAIVYAGAQVGAQMYVFKAATLAVDEVTINRPAGTITVSAVSLEARVNEDRYASATEVFNTAGTCVDVVSALVRRTLGATWPVNSAGLTSNPTFAAGRFQLDIGDVWPVIDDMMDAAGGEAFFTADGTLILRDVPTQKVTADLALKVGTGGTMVSYESRRRWAFNSVAIVYDDGDDTTTNVVGLWEDTNPASATYVSGPYGRHRRVDTVACNLGALPTQPSADAGAAALARRAAAMYRVVDMETVPAPWLIPGDTVDVTMLGGLVEKHLICRVSWPLTQLAPMRITTTDDTYTTP